MVPPLASVRFGGGSRVKPKNDEGGGVPRKHPLRREPEPHDGTPHSR